MILIKIQTLAGDAALGFVEALGFINAKIFLEFKLIDFIAKRRLELQIPYNSGSFMVYKQRGSVVAQHAKYCWTIVS